MIAECFFVCLNCIVRNLACCLVHLFLYILRVCVCVCVLGLCFYINRTEMNRRRINEAPFLQAFLKQSQFRGSTCSGIQL